MGSTDKNIYYEKRLIAKLELMATRLEGQDDNVVVIDGDEGVGKTNLATALCYYIAWRVKRKYNVDNIFFDLDSLINYASSTKEQIIHWDEAALGGLSVQWWKENQTKFMQLLMVARKKKHFIVMCIPKFNYLREYFLIDRAIALIHVYARQNIHKGRFFYFTKRKKEMLNEVWKRKHIRMYMRYKSFGGTFPKAMEKIFTPEQLLEYDKKKDRAILSIAQSPTKVDKNKEELEDLKYRLATIKGVNKTSLAEDIGVNRRTIGLWTKLKEKPMISGGG